MAGAAVAWPSPTLPKILSGETLLCLDTTETSWMVSLLYLGEAAGALPSSYLSDKIGRKKTLLYSGVFPIISWLIILTSNTALCLYVSRFLAGLQIGVITIVYPLYISEVSQTDIRGSLTALSNITLNAGIFFVSVVGPFVSPHVLVALFLFLSGLFPLSFQLAPESPHYMLRRDDINRARNSLLWLRGDLNRIELEFELDRIENVVETQSQERGSMREVFSSEVVRKDLLVVLVLSVLDGLSGVNVIQAYATTTFPKAAFGILTPDDCMIILSSATFMSSFIATYVSEIFHGKTLGVASYFGCSFSMGVVAVSFFLNSKTEVNIPFMDVVPLVGCLVHLIICSFFHSTSLRFIDGCDLPSKMMTNLTIISTILKSTMYFVLNELYLQMAQWEGVYVNFLIYSISCLVAASFFTIFWVFIDNSRNSQFEQEKSTEDERSKSSLDTMDGTF